MGDGAGVAFEPLVRQLPALMKKLIHPALWGALMLFPGDAEAQFIPLTVPKGRYAFELSSDFRNWDRRFRNGDTESVGADFSPSMIGSNFFPAIQGAESALSRAAGLEGPAIDLGRTRIDQLVSVRGFGLGLLVGVSNRLTLFGRLPFRRVRVETTFLLDSTLGNAGFNPADPTFGSAAGAAEMLNFFSSFDNAIGSLQDRIASGDFDSDPTGRALAMETLASARSLRDDLFTAILDPDSFSPFLPTSTSTAGAALNNQIAALQSLLSGPLGIPGFSQSLALPTTKVSDSDFTDFLTNPDGPIAGSLEAPPFTALGDAELGGAYLLVSKEGNNDGWQLRSVVQATVRLRTSRLDNADRFFDHGTGDRQPDIEGALVTDGARGRAAFRVALWYTAQLSGNQLRRIGAPSQPIQYASTKAAVSRNPGDIIGVSLLPAYRFTPRFAFLGGIEAWRRGADSYRFASGQTPIEGLDPAILSDGESTRALSLRLGVTFSHPGTKRDGSPRSPLDADVTWERVISADGGRVPQSETVRATLRLYGKFW